MQFCQFIGNFFPKAKEVRIMRMGWEGEQNKRKHKTKLGCWHQQWEFFQLFYESKNQHQLLNRAPSAQSPRPTILSIVTTVPEANDLPSFFIVSMSTSNVGTTVIQAFPLYFLLLFMLSVHYDNFCQAELPAQAAQISFNGTKTMYKNYCFCQCLQIFYGCIYWIIAEMTILPKSKSKFMDQFCECS